MDGRQCSADGVCERANTGADSRANFFPDDLASGYLPNKMFHSTPGIRSLQTIPRPSQAVEECEGAWFRK